MKKSLHAFLACVSIVATALFAQPRAFGQPPEDAKPLVVLIGDSILGGYKPVVQREMEASARIVSAGSSTSRDVLEKLDKNVIALKPALVHINCGLHDCYISPKTGQVQVPLQEYRTNLETIFQRLQSEAHTKVIWATTTPVNEQRQKAVPPPKGYGALVRRQADILEYNRASIEVARRFGIPVDDLFQVVTEAGADRYLKFEGIHFTEDGYELLGQAVVKSIRENLTR